MTRAIMLQGTGSDVGKSVLVAGLCRAARQQGLSVAPFKPQNMSNNAAATPDGGEIGRAQALQALAAGLKPHTDMNPVLLKPESETGSQVIVQGKRFATARARDYAKLKPQLMTHVLESFERLKARHDLVIVEGAGSPAEVNLRAGDIANMGFAQAAGVPVVLCGDINRGGVIAQIVGTQAVLTPEDAALVQGFLINKFRGDSSLFDDGYAFIQDQTDWPGFGVIPWFDTAWKLPAEDAYDIGTQARKDGLHVVCLQLARIANFDDLDPLVQEPGVRVTMLRAGQALPGDTDVVILPGSKSTRGDLRFLKQQGWDVDIKAHLRRGGHVLGLCGGYQMLGTSVADPDGIEGPPGTDAGLGFLDVTTVMTSDKQVRPTSATHCASGQGFTGYEIHLGQTEGADCSRPFAQVGPRFDGAISPDGRVSGTYLHGMFSDDAFRALWLAEFGVKQQVTYAQSVDRTLDGLAEHLRQHADVEGLLNLKV
ncbi:cobyric acid synthase [Roseobacter weihaiensis]|uniref:cobyric acid synthase n=1 Tax=Roseobacter weihaiensis TaxID=2763262 RepID=UPI001D0A9B17|nr:cobyric acid synthase [Roseobacter sp. H9]